MCWREYVRLFVVVVGGTGWLIDAAAAADDDAGLIDLGRPSTLFSRIPGLDC
jgi:hypothetical protein